MDSVLIACVWYCVISNVKTVTSILGGHENAAQGCRPGVAFLNRGHSFSLYGLILSQQITLFYSSVHRLTSEFVYANLSLNWFTCFLQTIGKKM